MNIFSTWVAIAVSQIFAYKAIKYLFALYLNILPIFYLCGIVRTLPIIFFIKATFRKRIFIIVLIIAG